MAFAFLAFAEAHVLCQNLGCVPLVSVLVRVIAGLDRTFQPNHLAFVEVFTDKLGGLPPGYAVNEIRLLVFELTVDGDTERHNREPLEVCFNSGSAVRRPIRATVFIMVFLLFGDALTRCR